eukprot:PhM_4_TR9766/c0_g1_i1/m.95451
MFRLSCARRALKRSCLVLSPISTVPWEAALKEKGVTLPEKDSFFYDDLGRSIVKKMLPYDAGPATYKECLVARGQLEMILRSCGYDLDVKFFGGLVTLGFFEVSGDLDFVGVGDTEPRHEEAAAIVQRVAREMRRLGLRPMAVPRARVPVIRCDRTSVALPGTPVPREASCVTFPFSRSLEAAEQELFAARLHERYGAMEVGWREDKRCATVRFPDTWAAVNAMANVRKQGDVEIPIRAPLDSRNGPELYRFPFDMCFGTQGMQNTFLMREALLAYPGSRHILLALKKWGKACGTINSLEGFLASYAYTAMLSHFLVQTGRIEPLRPEEMLEEPHLLPKDPPYVPLERENELNTSDVGYVFAHFFAYYAHIFDYENDVVSSTMTGMKKTHMKWTTPDDGTGRPPFYFFGMKDPYGNDNIARSVDANRLRYIRDALTLATHAMAQEQEDGEFVLAHLVEDPSRPDLKQPLVSFDAADARRRSMKRHFQHTDRRKSNYGAAAMQQRKTNILAHDIAESVSGWLKKDD